MKKNKSYIAIEGTVCAGKTTLCKSIEELIQYVTIIPDYSDFAGGGNNLPPPFPSSLEEESEALNFFLNLESNRFSKYDKESSTYCFIDRSVYTLLAHCYSISKLSSLSYFDLAKQILLSSSHAVWPSTIIFLDISQETILNRNKDKFLQGNIFIDESYNKFFKDFFLQGIITNKPFVIDAEKSKQIVCRQSIELLERQK